jgi:hypothetical protein
MISSPISNISKTDFMQLIKWCLYEDRYAFDGTCRQQTTGIAMGNCAAPPFAIIYMHEIEEEIFFSRNGAVISMMSSL